MEKWQEEVQSGTGGTEDMTPEEAGKAVGAFFKAMGEKAED